MTDKGNKPSIKAPWLAAESESVSDVVRRLVNIMEEKYSPKRRPRNTSQNLHPKVETQLKQSFRHAEQARGKGMKAMTALAEAMGVLDHDNAGYMAPMKEWDRAVEKLSADGRNLHDLGRGRIRVRSPDKIEAFYKILKTMNKDGSLDAFKTDRVRIIPGSIDDYLAEQRSSGYAGSINFDLEVEIGKGRIGKLEVQLMPRDYVQTYDLSHHLFKMIRALDEVPKGWRTEEHEKVSKMLKSANAALFDEVAERFEFASLRKKPYETIDDQKLIEINTILDMIRTEIDNLDSKKKPPEWREDTKNALTYAKTSVTNKFMTWQLKQNRYSRPSRDQS